MGYQRKKYHSGLTYQQECELCHTVVRYTDKILDFRPWYADGFVYCPTCEKPLRHNEKYAIDPDTGEYLNLSKPTVVSNTKTSSSATKPPSIIIEFPISTVSTKKSPPFRFCYSITHA